MFHGLLVVGDQLLIRRKGTSLGLLDQPLQFSRGLKGPFGHQQATLPVHFEGARKLPDLKRRIRAQEVVHARTPRQQIGGLEGLQVAVWKPESVIVLIHGREVVAVVERSRIRKNFVVRILGRQIKLLLRIRTIDAFLLTQSMSGGILVHAVGVRLVHDALRTFGLGSG